MFNIRLLQGSEPAGLAIHGFRCLAPHVHVRSLGIQALGDVRGQFIALYGYHATQRHRRIE
ncbi:hypothetical protein D3C79_846540 [compost metagenome]